MPDPEKKTVIIELTWDDLLNFGTEYEAIWQLMADRIEDELGLPETSELFVTDYGFIGVVDAGCVEVEVEVEINHYEDEEEVYRITSKGRFVLALQSKLGLSYSTASEMADLVYPVDGEVVAS
jgi:hypothetical protein